MMARRLLPVCVLAAASLLGGCSLLSSAPPQLYDLSPKNTFDDAAPAAAWQLVVEEPTTPNAINTDRIAVRPSALVVQYFGGVKWTDRAPALVQTLLVESFENSGKIIGVGRRSVGMTGDYVLTSAWENRGIEESFKKLVRAIQKELKPTQATPGTKPVAGPPQGDKLTTKDAAKDKKDEKDKKCCGGN